MKHVHLRISEMKYKPGNRRQNLDLHMKGKKGIWFQSLVPEPCFPWHSTHTENPEFQVHILLYLSYLLWRKLHSSGIHHLHGTWWFITLTWLGYLMKEVTHFKRKMTMFRPISELWAHNRSTGAMLLRLWTKSVSILFQCARSSSVTDNQKEKE